METTNAISSLSNGLSFWVIILIVVIILIALIAGMYNWLVKLRQAVKEALSDIDAQMQLRFDLVENLVNTVKGYSIHEKETLLSARSREYYLYKSFYQYCNRYFIHHFLLLLLYLRWLHPDVQMFHHRVLVFTFSYLW